MKLWMVKLVVIRDRRGSFVPYPAPSRHYISVSRFSRLRKFTPRVTRLAVPTTRCSVRPARPTRNFHAEPKRSRGDSRGMSVHKGAVAAMTAMGECLEGSFMVQREERGVMSRKN